MGVYIKDIEMPSNCEVCPLNYDSIDCMVADNVLREKGGGDFLFHHERHPNCPLVPVPDHGRLIDADAFDERIRIAGGLADEELSDCFKDGVQTTLLMLKTQRTIIPAEEGE